ncbi:MAG: 2TM domain-containing protein [Oscillospiraceae bacterium]|nr:2TM domain-containing protein [Oscillospiraceae bacterium]
MQEPTPRITDEELMKQARANVQRKKEFKIHLAVYLAVNAFLTGIFFVTSRHAFRAYFWPMWPMLGWGLGVAIHGAVVYLGGNSAKEVDQVKKEYQKLKDAQGEKND